MHGFLNTESQVSGSNLKGESFFRDSAQLDRLEKTVFKFVRLCYLRSLTVSLNVE